MTRKPKSELPTVNITALEPYYGAQYRLLRRQFPRRVRALLLFDVRMHEGVPWVAVHRDDKVSGWCQLIDQHGNETVIASAPLLPVTKRFENMLVEYAVIDPELLAYVLISL